MSFWGRKEEPKAPAPSHQQWKKDLPTSSAPPHSNTWPSTITPLAPSYNPATSIRQPPSTHSTTRTNQGKLPQGSTSSTSDPTSGSDKSDIHALLRSYDLDSTQIKTIEDLIRAYHQRERDELKAQRRELAREKEWVDRRSRENHDEAIKMLESNPFLTSDLEAWRDTRAYQKQLRAAIDMLRATNPGILNELRSDRTYWQERAQEFEASNQKLKADKEKLEAALRKSQQKPR